MRTKAKRNVRLDVASGRAELTFKADAAWVLLCAEDGDAGVVILINRLVLEMLIRVARRQDVRRIIGSCSVNNHCSIWKGNEHAAVWDRVSFPKSIDLHVLRYFEFPNWPRDLPRTFLTIGQVL